MDETSQADRRVQRTRQLLQNALMTLIEEQGYDSITIQDITERANLGRTTFYAHYRSKEDLFLSCHKHLGTVSFALSGAGLLGAEPLPELAPFLEHMQQNRKMYFFITQGSGADEIVRGVREQIVANIQANLRSRFREEESAVPFDVLANYIAGSQIALIGWWMESRAPYSPQEMVRMLHQLQTAVIKGALGVQDPESGTGERQSRPPDTHPPSR
jgi:AcrR family transcriptional regulator